MSNDEIRDMIEEKTKDIDAEVKVNMQAMDMSSLTGEGIRIDIKGRNLDTLREISEELMERVKSVKGTIDVTNELENSGKEFRVQVDKAKAMRYSLTVAQVFSEVQKKVAEATSSSKISTDTNDYNVFIKSQNDEDLTRDLLRSMKIDYTDAQTQKKKSVTLSKIASFETVPSPVAIKHHGQSRTVSVKGAVDEGYITSEVSAEVEKAVSAYEPPAGYTVELNGENETTQESLKQVGLMMVLAVLLMYLIMVAQFQGLLSPFIIMFTIPLAFTGGFLALFVTRNNVSIIGAIGFVMLAGIIVNNGIVMVDFINQLRGEGMNKKEAIVEAGKARLRPILMTTLTTVISMSTLALGIGGGSAMMQPMAIVMIGGLVYGTLLTLLVVPCLYDIFNSNKSMKVNEYGELVEDKDKNKKGEMVGDLVLQINPDEEHIGLNIP